jgi:hypothetical protein
LMDICGACERIQKTPISQSYRWFIRQSIAIYLLTLPWGLMLGGRRRDRSALLNPFAYGRRGGPIPGDRSASRCSARARAG